MLRTAQAYEGGRGSMKTYEIYNAANAVYLAATLTRHTIRFKFYPKVYASYTISIFEVEVSGNIEEKIAEILNP